ncbi:MAG: tetratricopeptide repeat protein [Gemmataceae bacterium]|nr:tetratricopeptide repeat protein [Gemmataceae bacterium]
MRVLDRLRLAARPRRPGRLTVLVVVAVGLLGWQGVRLARAYLAQNRAEAALARYDFPAARDQARRAADLRPGKPAVWLLAAQAARRDGDPDAAAAHLRRYAALAGSTPDGRLEDTLQRVQAGDIERDVDDLMAKIDAGHPATEQLLEALAVGSVHVYHFGRARFWVDHLLARFPANPTGRLIRARMDDVLGKLDRATAGCRELVADFPDHREAKALLAGLLFRAQQYPEAAELYEGLWRQRPDELRPLLGLTRCRERMDRADDVRALARELEGRFGGTAEAVLECGRLALTDGRADDAERLLRRAVELAPNDHEAHYQLGLCLERAGKAEEARQHLERYKRIESDLVRLDELLKAVVGNPQDPAPRREAGLICLRNGQPGEALRWLQGALEVAPNDPATRAALAEHFPAQAGPTDARPRTP